MGPVHLFDLATNQAQWLSMRQTVVSQNIANANTPGYKSADVVPFVDVLDDTTVRMAATQPTHMGQDPSDPETIGTKASKAWETTYSGNSVSVEQELIKAGEVNRSYSLNAGITKAFNQMMSSVLKG